MSSRSGRRVSGRPFRQRSTPSTKDYRDVLDLISQQKQRTRKRINDYSMSDDDLKFVQGKIKYFMGKINKHKEDNEIWITIEEFLIYILNTFVKQKQTSEREIDYITKTIVFITHNLEILNPSINLRGSEKLDIRFNFNQLVEFITEHLEQRMGFDESDDDL